MSEDKVTVYDKDQLDAAQEVQHKAQLIGEFLDWLRYERANPAAGMIVELGMHDGKGRFIPYYYSTPELVMDFLEAHFVSEREAVLKGLKSRKKVGS